MAAHLALIILEILTLHADNINRERHKSQKKISNPKYCKNIMYIYIPYKK